MPDLIDVAIMLNQEGFDAKIVVVPGYETYVLADGAKIQCGFAKDKFFIEKGEYVLDELTADEVVTTLVRWKKRGEDAARENANL